MKSAENMLHNGDYGKARESANEARDEAIRARETAQEMKPQVTPVE